MTKAIVNVDNYYEKILFPQFTVIDRENDIAVERGQAQPTLPVCGHIR